MRYLTHFFTDVLGWPGFVSGQYTTTPPVLGRRRRGGPRAVNSASSDADQARNSQQEHEATHSSSASPQIGAHKSQRPRISFFFRQLSIYLFSLFLMKVMVVVVFAILPSLSNIGRWVLERFGDDRRAQVFFVMALFPLAMNTVQVREAIRSRSSRFILLPFSSGLLIQFCGIIHRLLVMPVKKIWMEPSIAMIWSEARRLSTGVTRAILLHHPVTKMNRLFGVFRGGKDSCI